MSVADERSDAGTLTDHVLEVFELLCVPVGHRQQPTFGLCGSQGDGGSVGTDDVLERTAQSLG